MSYFSTKKHRKEEEYLYSVVSGEIERNEIYKPLWTKALADSNSDKQITQALYIKYRVQKLKDDISDAQEAQKESDAQKEQEAQKLREQKERELYEKNNPDRWPNPLRVFIFIFIFLIFLFLISSL